jgi:hypothetical protein
VVPWALPSSLPDSRQRLFGFSAAAVADWRTGQAAEAEEEKAKLRRAGRERRKALVWRWRRKPREEQVGLVLWTSWTDSVW